MIVKLTVKLKDAGSPVLRALLLPQCSDLTMLTLPWFYMHKQSIVFLAEFFLAAFYRNWLGLPPNVHSSML